MSVKLRGNELYKLYKFNDEKQYIFMYKRKGKDYHPGFEGYLAIRTKRGKAKLQWFAVSDSTTYGWDEVSTIDPKHGKAMIKTIFEKDLNPPLKEVLY